MKPSDATPTIPRLGIDLGGTKIEIIALDGKGRELLRRRVATPRGDYEATLDAIQRLVEACESALGIVEKASIGIGTPGTFSRANGLMRNCNSVWLNGRPLGEDLVRLLDRPVTIANDANCFALSEATDGAGAGAECVFGVILGTGVGGGLVVNRRVLEGPNGIAGEWGHNPLPWPEDGERPGPDCYCGKRGCIETFLSGPGLANDHARATGERLTPEQIVDNATKGEAICMAALARYEGRLARALAHVINILDPDVIVLGGGLSNLDRLFERVPLLWGAFAFTDRVDTRLVRHAHGDSSGVRGAAWLGACGVRQADRHRQCGNLRGQER
jgi:fructokinase